MQNLRDSAALSLGGKQFARELELGIALSTGEATELAFAVSRAASVS